MAYVACAQPKYVAVVSNI